MRRYTKIAVLAGVFVACGAALAYGQQGWPPYSTGSSDPHFIDRGFPGEDAGGWYLSGIKLFLYWLIFLFWVRSADWVNRDLLELGERTGLDYVFWNSLVALPFIPGLFFCGFCLPFFIGFPLLIISYVAPFAAYVVHRNSLVRDDERVFMPKNVSDWF